MCSQAHCFVGLLALPSQELMLEGSQVGKIDEKRKDFLAGREEME